MLNPTKEKGMWMIATVLGFGWLGITVWRYLTYGFWSALGAAFLFGIIGFLLLLGALFLIDP